MDEAERTEDRLRRAIGVLTAWVEMDDDPRLFQTYLASMTETPQDTRQTLAGLTALAGLLLVLLAGKSPPAQLALLEELAREYGV
jgi:hypothetical protein